MSGWIRPAGTRVLFQYSAWTVFCMGIFMVFMLAPWFRDVEAMPHGDLVLRIAGALLGVTGAFASLVIFVGMIIFCLREDRSPTWVKVLWLILFLITACFGTALYFFAVYRRQIQDISTSAAV